MVDIQQLVRKNIRDLKPYSSARDEFKGTADVFLDANENPYGTLNRYPDPYQTEVKQELAKLKSVTTNQIFIGNGSDEVIDLAFRIFCEPSKDKALTFSPTYGMYDVSANINNIELIKVPLNNDFQIDIESVKPYFEDENLKLIFICSPNNPTGNCLEESTIEFILQNFNGIVIIDEAYIDFNKEKSLIKNLDKYNNLIVSQTFSKAFGLASVRVGVAYANSEIITLYNNVKPPYNVSSLNQEAVLASLKNSKEYEENVQKILSEKERLIQELNNLEIVQKIYPSDANFLLVEVNNATKVYEQLIEQKIIVRNRNSLVRNCVRITVGTSEENKKLVKELQDLTGF